MNRLGVDGVRTQRARWLQHLFESYDSTGWWERASAALLALKLGLPLTVEGLLDEALRRAEVKENTAIVPADH
jgi:hypothetical protein